MFQTEQFYDTLSINERQYSGNDMISAYFRVKNGSIWFHFRSDADVSREGFRLHWSCMPTVDAHCGKIDSTG